MSHKIPSIFNDVIGPVMRGPSSSHCAAAVRIGLLARALMSNSIESVLVEFDSRGSLPTTHETHGSDMGLFGGLLGFEPSDKRLVQYKEEIRNAGIQIQFKSGSYGDSHPNTYRLSLKNASESHSLVAVSTGGGIIEVVEIDEMHTYVSSKKTTAGSGLLLIDMGKDSSTAYWATAAQRPADSSGRPSMKKKLVK